MAKTKIPGTTSTRSKKNGNVTDLPATPVVAAAAAAPAPEVRAEITARPDVKTPELPSTVKVAEPKPVEAREPRKTLTEVRRDRKSVV